MIDAFTEIISFLALSSILFILRAEFLGLFEGFLVTQIILLKPFSITEQKIAL